MERGFGAKEIRVFGIAPAEAFLGALFGPLRALYIYLFGSLSCLSKDGDRIRADFGVTAAGCKIMSVAADAVAHFAGLQGGQERGMAREDAEIAHLSRSGYFIDLLLEESSLRDNYF